MLKLFKITIINILIFFVFILLIEVIFGYWFDKDNLGPYVREHRLRKVNYEVTYEGTQYSFTYERNYYGFRGKDVPLDNIKGVIVGGSTTDERYKPEEFTITELINSYLKNKNINFKLYNAGIEGQSTRGHAVNIDYWFKKLPNFKPNFIFYYIGINDQWVTSDVPAIRDGKILSLDKKEVFFDNLKSRSVTYDLLRKAKHIFYSSDKRLLYDFDKGIEAWQNKKIDFLNYDEFMLKNNLNEIMIEYFELISAYQERVKKLHDKTIEFGSIPVFINQLSAEGYNNKVLVSLNSSLMNLCKTNNYYCIDLSKQLKGESDYWWDGIHTTPKGSEAISKIIAPEIETILKNNNFK